MIKDQGRVMEINGYEAQLLAVSKPIYAPTLLCGTSHNRTHLFNSQASQQYIAGWEWSNRLTNILPNHEDLDYLQQLSNVLPGRYGRTVVIQRQAPGSGTPLVVDAFQSDLRLTHLGGRAEPRGNYNYEPWTNITTL